MSCSAVEFFKLTHGVQAYKPNGDFVSINKKKFTATSQTHWGNTGVWIDNSDELQGWAPDGHLVTLYNPNCHEDICLGSPVLRGSKYY